MLRKIILLLFVSVYLNSNNTYFIQNFGQQTGQNYIALYDELNKNSTLVGGYTSEQSDNGHCVSGISDGQALTLIFPENLSAFGLLNSSCKGTDNNSPSCENSVLCDVVVTEGAQVAVNYGGNTVTRTLHVSPLCNSIGNYIINNFADNSNKNFKISEYASCDPTKPSYCAVQFTTPSDKSYQLKFNSELVYPQQSSSLVYNACTVAANAATTTGSQVNCNNMLVSNLQQNPSCYFNISGSSVNDWVTQNLNQIKQGSSAVPPQGAFVCSNQLSESAVSQEITNIYANYDSQVNELVNKAMLQSGYPAMPPIPMPPNPTQEEKNLVVKYQAFMRNNPSKIPLMEKTHFLLTQTIANQINEKTVPSLGTPCIGTVSLDTKGNPMVIYSCTTSGLTPAYDCTFVYTYNTKTSAMELTSSYCDIPDLYASKVCENSIDACGFCGAAEKSTVGANSVNNQIESSNYGSPGELYPFDTSKAERIPSCSSGFISNLGGGLL